MKPIFAPLAVLLSIALANAAFAAGPGSANVRLEAQLWTRPLGADGRLKFKLLGGGKEITKTLDPQSRITRYTTKISANEVFATATFLVVPATAKAAPYLVTQVRVYNAATQGLIAECANYDSVAGERSPGVGVCSGAIGDAQYGLTLSSQ